MAEGQAVRLLSILDQYEPPVDIGLIAELPRIEVRVVTGRDLAGLSGASEWLRSTSHWLIAINGDDAPTRRRFTLGHEFKHILDNPFVNVLYQGLGYPERTVDERAERVCDLFAACLLMPRPWVKRLWTQGVQDTATLAATFKVSPAAMDLRLQKLGLTPPRRRWQTVQDWPTTGRTYFRKRPAIALVTAA